MNYLMLDQQKREQETPAKNKKVVDCIVNNSILRKPLFDTESYYYFTEVWKYRPFR